MDVLLQRIRNNFLTKDTDLNKLVADAALSILQKDKWKVLFEYIKDKEQAIIDEEEELERIRRNNEILEYKHKKYRRLIENWESFIERFYDIDFQIVDFIRNTFSKRESDDFVICDNNGNPFWRFNLTIKKSDNTVKLIFDKMAIEGTDFLYYGYSQLCITKQRLFNLIMFYFITVLNNYFKTRYNVNNVLYTVNITEENKNSMSYISNNCFRVQRELYAIVDEVYRNHACFVNASIFESTSLSEFLDKLCEYPYDKICATEAGFDTGTPYRTDPFTMCPVGFTNEKIKNLRIKKDDVGADIVNHPNIEFLDFKHPKQCLETRYTMSHESLQS